MYFPLQVSNWVFRLVQSMARYAKRIDANRLRELEPKHRRSVIICFLCQLYRDTMDHLVDMYDKLINKIYNHAQKDVDDYNKSQRKQIRESLKTFDSLTNLILDESIDDATLRKVMFDKIGRDLLLAQKEAVDAWLNGKHSHIFNLVKGRFSYIRQFSPQWDRMGHFYASLEYGHTTASTAMKRLNGFSRKNHFYRASRELGRIFKTEYILKYMSDKTLRQNVRKGLLKGEQIHSLARDFNYGKRGRINTTDLREQKNSCSCMTLIIACIIYWQAKEINRVVLECDPEGSGVDLALLQHVSPITWDNVILYGEYMLDRNLVKI